MDTQKKVFTRLAVLLLLFIIVAAAMPTASAGWDYYRVIEIDHTKVNGSQDLSSFPVLISHTDDWLKDSAHGGGVKESHGYDIVFTNADDSSLLDFEIEKYDGTVGTLVAWVRIPTLDHGNDTAIRLYYGNSAASDWSNAAGVWDTNYKGVWHLEETAKTDGTYNDHLDSTSNDNDGEVRTAYGASVTDETFKPKTLDTAVQLKHRELYTSPSPVVTSKPAGTTYTENTDYTIDCAKGQITVLSTGSMAADTEYLIEYTYDNPGADMTATGQVNGADDFDGVDDYVNCGCDTSLNITDAITISAWVKPGESDSYQTIVDKGSYYDDAYALLVKKDIAYIKFSLMGIDQHWGYGRVDFLWDEDWHYITGTYDKDGGSNNLRLYVDGSCVNNSTHTEPITSATKDVFVGGHSYDGNDFNGTIDEVRISASARSGDWISTTYNNAQSPSTFYSVGVETPTGGTAPVPELPTIILVCIGLIVLAGYVMLRRRR